MLKPFGGFSPGYKPYTGSGGSVIRTNSESIKLIGEKLRESELYAVNKTEGKCPYCTEPVFSLNYAGLWIIVGDSASTTPLIAVDHIYPASLGYPTSIGNLIPIHYRCNEEKSAMLPCEYFKYLEKRNRLKYKSIDSAMSYIDELTKPMSNNWPELLTVIKDLKDNPDPKNYIPRIQEVCLKMWREGVVEYTAKAETTSAKERVLQDGRKVLSLTADAFLEASKNQSIYSRLEDIIKALDVEDISLEGAISNEDFVNFAEKYYKDKSSTLSPEPKRVTKNLIISLAKSYDSVHNTKIHDILLKSENFVPLEQSLLAFRSFDNAPTSILRIRDCMSKIWPGKSKENDVHLKYLWMKLEESGFKFNNSDNTADFLESVKSHSTIRLDRPDISHETQKTYKVRVTFIAACLTSSSFLNVIEELVSVNLDHKDLRYIKDKLITDFSVENISKNNILKIDQLIHIKNLFNERYSGTSINKSTHFFYRFMRRYGRDLVFNYSDSARHKNTALLNKYLKSRTKNMSNLEEKSRFNLYTQIIINCLTDPEYSEKEILRLKNQKSPREKSSVLSLFE